MKEKFKILFNKLYDNKVVYHERISILCEVVSFELNEEDFQVELKYVKNLNDLRSYQRNMLNRITSRPSFTVGSSYFFQGKEILNDNIIGRHYCPYIIWADSDMVKLISEMNDDELRLNLKKILWNN
jgi:hypothetical protein